MRGTLGRSVRSLSGFAFALLMVGCGSTAEEDLRKPVPRDGGVLEDAGMAVSRCVADWNRAGSIDTVRITDFGEHAWSDLGCFADDLSFEPDVVHLFAHDYEYRSFVFGARQAPVTALRNAGGPLGEVLSSTISGTVPALRLIPRPHRRSPQSGLIYPLMLRRDVAHDLQVSRGAMRSRTSTIVRTTDQVGARDAQVHVDFSVVIGSTLSVGLEVVAGPSKIELLGSSATRHGLYFFEWPLRVDEVRSGVMLGIETEMTYPIRVEWDDEPANHMIGWMTEDGWFGSRLQFSANNRIPIVRPDVVHLVPPEGVFANAKLFAMRTRWPGSALQWVVEIFEHNENDTVVFPRDTMPDVLSLEMDAASRRSSIRRSGPAASEKCVVRLGTEDGRAWAVELHFDGSDIDIQFPEVPDGFVDPVPDWSEINIECRRYRGWDPETEPEPTKPYDGLLSTTTRRR